MAEIYRITLPMKGKEKTDLDDFFREGGTIERMLAMAKPYAMPIPEASPRQTVQARPVQQAPVQQAPVQQAPVQQAPVQQAPVQPAPSPVHRAPPNVVPLTPPPPPPPSSPPPNPRQPKPPPPQKRPRINISNRQAHEVIAESWDLLRGLNQRDLTLFRRSGYLTVVRRDENGPATHTLSGIGIQGYLIREADWIKYRPPRKGEVTDDSGMIECNADQPPGFISADMTAHVPQEEEFPVLLGIAQHPVVAPTGEFLTQTGYHPSAQIWLEDPAPPTPMRCASVEEARAILDEWLVDFPFVGDADRAHALSIALTLLARPIIQGPTPLHLIEAPKSRTGKSLLAKVLLSVVLGKEPSAASLPDHEEERRKDIATQLNRGCDVMYYDNLKGKLDSAALESVITSTSWLTRSLGSMTLLTMPNRAVWVATGNNVQYAGDWPGRIAQIRLDRKVERPETFDSYQHPDIEGYTQRNRSQILGALQTLIDAWWNAGRPGCSKRLGGFRGWAEVVGGILEYAGYEGFLTQREALDEGDEETMATRHLLSEWYCRYGSSDMSPTKLVTFLEEKSLLPNILEATNSHARAIRLGQYLQRHRNQVYGIEVNGQRINVRLTARVLEGQRLWTLAIS